MSDFVCSAEMIPPMFLSLMPMGVISVDVFSLAQERKYFP